MRESRMSGSEEGIAPQATGLFDQNLKDVLQNAFYRQRDRCIIIMGDAIQGDMSESKCVDENMNKV